MSWGDFAAADYAADTPGRQERGDYLVERDILTAGRPFALAQFVEFSTITASWQTAADFTIRTPDYAVVGWFLHAHLFVKVAAGTGGQVRLTNVTDSNDGTAQTGISNTSYAWSNDLSVQVDAGEHADVNIVIEVQGDGAELMYVDGGLGVSITYFATAWWAPT